jgi:beta-glucanase (GH16 family)
MPMKKSANLCGGKSFEGNRRNQRGRRGKNALVRLDTLEPRLLLSAYIFGDEFNEAVGGGPSSAWGAENATDPNNSAVHYTNTLPANATANNPATMQIVSDAQAGDGSALAMTLLPSPANNGTYDSAEISTRVDPSGLGNSLEYGEVSARIRIPGGNNSNAIWPAFWMLGDNINTVHWPNCGEVDIMENKGSTPGTNYSTLHGPASGGGDYNGGAGVGTQYNLPGGANFYSAYHIFSVSWGPNSVTFSVDGNAFVTFTPSSLPSGASWVFNGHPFYIILDVNEGGSFAPGTITSPQTMYVDWVHYATFSAAAVPVLTDQDIGAPAHAGSGYFDGITNTLLGGGTGIGGTSDQFNYDSQLLSSNFTLVTSVDWIGDTAQFAKGGLMVRSSTAANSAYAFLQMEPYGGGPSGTGAAVFEYRSSTGASAATAGTDTSANLASGPITLKLVRNGNVFTAYDSTNFGSTWNQIGPTETLALGSSVDVGLASTADNSSNLTTDTFTNLSILTGTFIDTNIGAPNRVGSAAVANNSATLNIGGGGAGITSTSDQFDFASQSLTGDGSIIANFQSMTATASLAAAGIMFRNDSTAGGAFAMLGETPSGGLVFEWRSSAGGVAQSTTVSAVNASWIKLLRSGNSFSAYYSTDDTNWTQLGVSEAVTMNSAALVGAAVTAGDNGGALNVATFNLISVANAAAQLVYLTPPASTTAGSAFPSNVMVAVEDSSGRVVQSDFSTVTISVASGTGALQGTLTVTAKNGVATFANVAAAAPGTGGITVTDGALTPATSSAITISNPPGVAPVGAATYVMSGYPGTQTMDVTSGVVNLTSDQSLNFTSLLLKIESGASVTLQADQHINGLQLVGTGTLDANNCALFINYGGAADPITTIAGYLNSGYNGGLWNGTGIFSTAAAANSPTYALGYADSADPGNPAGLGAHTIKIMYTLVGDADLNGVVNGIDFGILSSNLNKSASSWDQGDFNYDGIVNGIDFTAMSSNFNQGAVGTASSATSTTAASLGVVVTNNPAPTSTTDAHKNRSRHHH